jgi:uncharacterized protein YjbI with pentapeptide repeats
MPQDDWSKAEWWVWKQVCACKIADFHECLGKLDPRSDTGWGEDRLLSTIFIREIFYDKSFAGEIPLEGVRIRGAWFRDRLALSFGRLHRHLWLEASRFDQGIDFYGQTIEGRLSLEESFVAAPADSSATIALTGAKIDGSLSLQNATIEGRLVMNGLHVSQNLFMQRSEEQPTSFAEVDLTNANIEGQLVLSGATVAGRLMMNGLQVGESLFLQGSKAQPASFGEVDLTTAHIKGQLSFIGANVGGRLAMNDLLVDGSLLMRGSDDGQPPQFQDVDLSYAEVSGGLDLTGARFAGRLILRNARASVLHEDGSWPKYVELDGFTYDRIGGIGEMDSVSLDRQAFRERYVAWLEHDPTYTPQPYEQLAGVFRRAGEPERASDVLYASRERARRKAGEERVALFGFLPVRVCSRRYLGMSLLNWTIGYGVGYRYFRCLWWILGFTALGTAVLYLGVPTIEPGDCVVYSLVKLLPFAKLDEFKGVTLSSLAKCYFYLHQLVGYVLAGFLAAGLAGLTQKS